MRCKSQGLAAMTHEGDVVFFEELADEKVLVDNGYMYRVRVEILKLLNELVRSLRPFSTK